MCFSFIFILFLYYYFNVIFIILVFCEGSGGFRVGSGWFRVLPGRFRVVPGGSGRFRVGSASYIHPANGLRFRKINSLLRLVGFKPTSLS